MVEHKAVKGVVLAGVHAWGNCALERVAPRPLMPVGGYPLVLHTLSWLRDGGVRQASICANSDTVHLRRKLGNGSPWNINLDYYQDVMPRGPAGCTRDAIQQTDAQTILVAEATIIPRMNLSDLLAAHRQSGAALTVVSCPLDMPHTDGPPALQPAGVYVFSRAALALVPATGYQDIKEVLIPRLHHQGHHVATYTVDRWAAPRVNNVASYLAISKWAIERTARQPNPPQGYMRCGEARIHETAQIDAKARLIGPVLVEANCRIGAGAVIIGPTSLGEGCVIGEDAIVSRSALWGKCRIGSRTNLDHSILTDGVKVAPGNRLHGVVRIAHPSDILTAMRLWVDRWKAGRTSHGPQEATALMGPPLVPAVARQFVQSESRMEEACAHREATQSRAWASASVEGKTQ